MEHSTCYIIFRRWLVISNGKEVQINEEIKDYHPGEVAQISLGAHHRIENKTSEPVVFIEVERQTGRIVAAVKWAMRHGFAAAAFKLPANIPGVDFADGDAFELFD